MDISKNKKWLRKAAYAPLAAAVLAGAVCAGTGIGSATTTDPATTPDTLQSGETSSTAWSVQNLTGQPIYGQWDAWNSDGAKSRVAATADDPWQLGATAKADQVVTPNFGWTKWSGRTCYNKQYWDFYPVTLNLANNTAFKLEADSRGTLHASYTTFEGASGDMDHKKALTPTGVGC
ncbi:hypothetical protein [Rhodococcus jostii]|uniref:hypothetical protein n=1 Tax=Rhodococcus jostii TaxID=132919 RepID=UPI0036405EF2